MKDVLSQSSIAKFYFDFQRIIRGLSAWLKNHDDALNALELRIVALEERHKAMEQFVLNAEMALDESLSELEAECLTDE